MIDRQSPGPQGMGNAQAWWGLCRPRPQLESRLRPSGSHRRRHRRSDRLTEDHDTLVLGKAHLVAQLQLLLQTACLHLPRNAEAEILAQL